MTGTGDRPVSRRRLLAIGGAAWLAGCSFGTDHAGDHAPRAAPLPQPARVAWVLGSGGPRGFVHVGVVKALDEIGVRPDVVVGASVGAFVAVLCASGMPVADIESLAIDLQPWRLARLAFGADEWLSGAAVDDLIDDLVGRRVGMPLLERLPVMAVVAAQRLDDGEVVGFTRGDAGVAVQAATAIENRIAPVVIRGRRYGDADLAMPLPVRLARDHGAQRVLAVDASAHEDRAPPGTEQWRAGDLRKRALTRPDAELADLLLHPDTGYYAGMSREYRLRSIDIGYRETMAARDRIEALHAG